jgi:hypothetical protein
MKKLGVCLTACALLAALSPRARAQQPPPQQPRIEIDSAASNAVTAVAFSPDGRFLASANASGTIKVWNLATGRRNRTLRGPAGAVNAVAFSPDSNLLVAGGDDKTVRAWDLGGNGREILNGAHAARVLSVAYGGDRGNYLAAGSADGVIKVWDTASGQELRALAGHTGEVFGLAFARDGRTLASGSADSLRIWDAVTGVNPRTFKSSGSPFTSVALSPDAKLLAGGMRGRFIRLFDVAASRGAQTLTGHAAEVTSLSFGQDGTLASGSEDGTVKLWRAAAPTNAPAGPQVVSEMRSFVADAAAVKSLAFGSDAKLLATAAGGPATKLWQAETGRELASLVAPDAREWIVFTPVGHYDGTAGGMRSVNFVQSGRRVQIDAFFEQLYTPKLLAQIVLSLKGGDAGLPGPPGPASRATLLGTLSAPRRAGVDLTGAVRLPPLVRITLPAASAATPALRRSAQVAPAQPQAGERGIADDLAKADAATVTVEVSDQGGGIDEIRIYHNGKLVVADKLDAAAAQTQPPQPPSDSGNFGRAVAAPAPLPTITKSYRLALASGENVFRAVALNSDRTESQPAEAKVALPGGEPTADLYLVAVGLNEYKNPKYNLNFGRADATALAEEIERRGRGIFRKIDKQVILDAGATRASIEAALARVAASARPGDAFVFYYAGHGVMSEGAAGEQPEFHLAPHDVTQLFGNEQMLAERGVSARLLREWCRKIAAQKQLIVLDACQAGGAVETFAALRGVPEEKAILQLARSVGIIILAATGTEQVAAEFTKLGHGAFTYALLEGLSGKADGGSSPDGKITVKELEAFLNDMVPELTRQYRGTPQFPNSYSRGQDFPLGVK